MSLLRKHFDRLQAITESTKPEVDLIDTEVGNEPAEPAKPIKESTPRAEGGKTFAMALTIACTGGAWKRVEDHYAHLRIFEGKFPSENVEARVTLDTNEKTYTVVATKNGSDVLNVRRRYTTPAGIPVAVAFMLSQEAFGAPNAVTETTEEMPVITFKEHKYRNTEDLYLSMENFDAAGNDTDTIFCLAAENATYDVNNPEAKFSYEGKNFSVTYKLEDGDEDGQEETLSVRYLGDEDRPVVAEGLAIGDDVEVDGEEAVVKTPDAPGGTATVLVKGEEKVVNKAELSESASEIASMVRAEREQLDEMVLGMTCMPDITRMQALAGVRGAQDANKDMPLSQVAANVKAASAMTQPEAPPVETVEVASEVVDLSKEVGEQCSALDNVTNAIATIENNVGSLTIAQFKEIRDRLTKLGNVVFAESASPRPKKV